MLLRMKRMLLFAMSSPIQFRRIDSNISYAAHPQRTEPNGWNAQSYYTFSLTVVSEHFQKLRGPERNKNQRVTVNSRVHHKSHIHRTHFPW